MDGIAGRSQDAITRCESTGWDTEKFRANRARNEGNRKTQAIVWEVQTIPLVVWIEPEIKTILRAGGSGVDRRITTLQR